MAVAVLFSRITNFDPTGCNETPIEFTPLSEINVLWSWPGHGGHEHGQPGCVDAKVSFHFISIYSLLHL